MNCKECLHFPICALSANPNEVACDYFYANQKSEDKLTCDRNICLNNEYNNIGCEDCVVTKGDDKL